MSFWRSLFRKGGTPADPRFLLAGIDLSPSPRASITAKQCEEAFGRRRNGVKLSTPDYLINLTFDNNDILECVNVSRKLKTPFLAMDAPSPEEEWLRLGFFFFQESHMGLCYHRDGCTIVARFGSEGVYEIYYYVPDRSVEGPRTPEHHGVRQFGAKCPPGRRMTALGFKDWHDTEAVYAAVVERLTTGSVLPIDCVSQWETRFGLDDYGMSWVVHPEVASVSASKAMYDEIRMPSQPRVRQLLAKDLNSEWRVREVFVP